MSKTGSEPGRQHSSQFLEQGRTPQAHEGMGSLLPHQPLFTLNCARSPLFGGDQFYRIVDSAFNMDVKGKRIFSTGPEFVLGITKGEGPEHGEDHNYSKLGKGSGEVCDEARNENIKLQEDYVNKSLDFYKKEKGQTRRFVNRKVQVTQNVEAVFKALGDACHIAQDSGAHWEGTKGMGHGDDRARKGTWDPDDPTDNDIGYQNARNNTHDVFKLWTWGSTIEIGYDWG
jgi:hypothetical protein